MEKETLTLAVLCSGFLVSVDSYMNLQLTSTEEWVDGAMAGKVGEVLIRYVDPILTDPPKKNSDRERERERNVSVKVLVMWFVDS